MNSAQLNPNFQKEYLQLCSEYPFSAAIVAVLRCGCIDKPRIGDLSVDLSPYSERPAYHNAFRMRIVDGFEFTGSLEIHPIELSKVTLAKDNSQVRGPLEQWIHFS